MWNITEGGRFSFVLPFVNNYKTADFTSLHLVKYMHQPVLRQESRLDLL